MEEWYEGTLKWWMDTMFRRRILIWGPVILTILSFIFLTPRLLGGSLFPTDDSPFVFITVSAPQGNPSGGLQPSDLQLEFFAKVHFSQSQEVPKQ